MKSIFYAALSLALMGAAHANEADERPAQPATPASVMACQGTVQAPHCVIPPRGQNDPMKINGSEGGSDQ